MQKILHADRCCCFTSLVVGMQIQNAQGAYGPEEILCFGIRKEVDADIYCRPVATRAFLPCLTPLRLCAALFSSIFDRHLTEVAAFPKTCWEQKQMAAPSFSLPALFTSVFLWKLKLADVKLQLPTSCSLPFLKGGNRNHATMPFFFFFVFFIVLNISEQ